VAASGATAGSHRLVAKFTPGLRDYHHRLNGPYSKEPFEQQFTEPEGSSSAATESGGAEPAGTESAGGSTEGPRTTAPSSPETAPQPTPGPGNVVYYSYAIDVRVSAGGSATGPSTKPTVRKNLPELTMLPSRDTPAIIYMGSTRDGKKALMLISSDVDAIFGDGKCVLGSQTCELLALEPEVPETFVYGGAGRASKIKLLKPHLVKPDKLTRAPLGKPHKRGAGN